MNTNCPLFKIGTCKGYLTRECKYKFHKKCIDNFLCPDENCILGHGISFIKRTILINIYNKNSRKELYDKSTNKCNMPLVCSKFDCKFHHFLEYKDRQHIIYIINNNNSDKDALQYYNKKYEELIDLKDVKDVKDLKDMTNLKDLKDLKDIKDMTDLKDVKDVKDLTNLTNLKDMTDPKESLVNYKTGFNNGYLRKSYADSVKTNIIEDSYIIEDDYIIEDNYIIEEPYNIEDTYKLEDNHFTNTMDDIIEQHKIIKFSNSKIESIKKQIIDLELNLKEYENSIKECNNKLRNLAIKIVEI